MPHFRPGFIAVTKKNDCAFLVLMNFRVGSHDLQPEHKEALEKLVTPVMIVGGSATVSGLTSTTGSEARNTDISILRADSVLGWLTKRCGKELKIKNVSALGEAYAKARGVADNQETPEFRSVIIAFWESSIPPSFDPDQPGVQPPGVIPNNTAFGSSGPGLVSTGIDAISTVATGFQMVTGSAAAAAGSTTLAISGWAATILGPSLGGLVTIYEIHKAAEFNGLCEGYWDAYQLMAKQYSHESLRNPPPLKSWPPLQKPTPGKNKNVIDLSFTRTARKGYEVGFRKAYNDVLEMESSPKVIEVHPTALERTAGAKITRIKVTGRVFLRGLWLQYGDNVADMIHAELDKNLVKSGKGKWPIQ